jgi:hypothetical protein
MPIYKGFQAKNGIFALFSPKIRTWTTMPLKVGFIPGFRGLLTDCSRVSEGLLPTVRYHE